MATTSLGFQSIFEDLLGLLTFKIVNGFRTIEHLLYLGLLNARFVCLKINKPGILMRAFSYVNVTFFESE